MSDSVGTKSITVSPCKYRHDWTINPRLGEEKFICCRNCGKRPTEEQEKQAESIVALRGMLAPGSVVYTVLRHVSRSGMTRGIDLYLIQDNRPRCITFTAGHAIGSPQSFKDWKEGKGLRVSGCGMDMGFSLVHDLSRVLFGNTSLQGGLHHEWL